MSVLDICPVSHSHSMCLVDIVCNSLPPLPGNPRHRYTPSYVSSHVASSSSQRMPRSRSPLGTNGPVNKDRTAHRPDPHTLPHTHSLPESCSPPPTTSATGKSIWSTHSTTTLPHTAKMVRPHPHTLPVHRYSQPETCSQRTRASYPDTPRTRLTPSTPCMCSLDMQYTPSQERPQCTQPGTYSLSENCSPPPCLCAQDMTYTSHHGSCRYQPGIGHTRWTLWPRWCY
jgi:hypothetical protein